MVHHQIRNHNYDVARWIVVGELVDKVNQRTEELAIVRSQYRQLWWDDVGCVGPVGDEDIPGICKIFDGVSLRFDLDYVDFVGKP